MLPLSEITVLDLNRRYPGAYSAMILGDFGADVIKVDAPGQQFPAAPGIDTMSEKFAAYYALDRNKKTIVINMKSQEGQEVFYKLVKKADVLIEGFRPGVMKRLNADYDALKRINPSLIYCSLTGYGHDGPYANMPGHDFNYCAIAGLLNLIGPRDGPPYFASNFLADMAGAGLHGVIGILIALVARGKNGHGQFVDISYMDGAMSLLAMEASVYFASGIAPRRGETVSTGGAPWAQVFKCKDGEYFTIGCAEPHLWENLCRALEREDLIAFHNAPREKVSKVVADLAQIFLTKSRDEWFDLLKDKDTCIAPVYTLDETFLDPQVLHRRMLVEIEHPKLGKIKQLGIPIKLSDTPGRIRSLGSLVGTHTEEILHSLGYDNNKIKKLCQAGVVQRGGI